MRKEDTLVIDSERLKKRIRELGIKQEWLADQLCVNARTINRWLNGYTRRIAFYNLHPLSEILDCDSRDLIIEDRTPEAGIADKRNAIESILQDDLLQELSPSGKWKLVEDVIRGNLYSSIERDKLGELYNMLSAALWRQRKFNQAYDVAESAITIGNDLKNDSILVKALENQGTIYYFLSKHEQSYIKYKQCFHIRKAFASKKDLAAFYNNFAMSHANRLFLDQAYEYQQKAIQLYSELQLPFNLSIAYHCLGEIQAERSLLNEAVFAYASAFEAAQTCDYLYGKALNPLFIEDIEAGDRPDISFFEQQRHLLDDSLFSHSPVHVLFARAYRRVNRLDEARKIAENGLKILAPRSIEAVGLMIELAEIIRLSGQNPSPIIDKAIRIYKNTGLPRRAQLLSSAW